MTKNGIGNGDECKSDTVFLGVLILNVMWMRSQKKMIIVFYSDYGCLCGVLWKRLCKM